MTLAYEERGQGTPVVLLHAFPFSRLMWAAQLQTLSARARVIAPDLPGFGESPRLAAPSMAGMARAVLALLGALKIREPVVLGGLSMGGYVAFELLRQVPASVKALGLFSTRAAADTAEQRASRLVLIERIGREGFGPVSETLLPKLLGPTTLASRPEVVARVRELMRSATADGVTDALRAMASRSDCTDLLASITCPTLVVSGAEDAFIPSSEAEAMAQRIPGASLEAIASVGHLVNLEDPQRFHTALARLL